MEANGLRSKILEGAGVETAYGVQPTAETAHALARLSRYEEYRQLYGGEHWLTRAKPGERRITVNYCRVFVNKAASYLLGKPVGYEAFSHQGSGVRDQGSDAEARSVEQYLDEVGQFNAMAALDLDVGIAAGCLGDGAFTVRWDDESGMPRVTAVDVRGLDARWRQDDLRTLTWVRQRYWVAPVELSGEQFDRWAVSMAAGASIYEPVAAYEEWTAREWRVTVGGVEVDGGPNPYGEIPYVIFPNLRVPGEFWGEGDLVDIAAIQRELNERISVFSRILEVAGAPVTVIEGATDDETKGLKLGPNQQWTLPEGAKAYVLDLLANGGGDAHFKYVDLLYRTMHDVSEMPRTSFGDSSGQSQARSGVALEIELQPLLHKLARKQLILSGGFVRRAQLILKIARLHGAKLPEVGLRVAWPPALPQDREALVAQESLLVGAGVHPPTQAMQLLNEQDPAQLLERVLEENGRFVAAGLPSPMSAGRAGGAGNRAGSGSASSSASSGPVGGT